MNSKWLCHQCRLPNANKSKGTSDFCLFKSHSFSLLCFSLIYLAVGFVGLFLFFAVFIARFPFRLLSAPCGWWVSAAQCALVSAVGQQNPGLACSCPPCWHLYHRLNRLLGQQGTCGGWKRRERVGWYHSCCWELGLWPIACLLQPKMGLF